MRMVFLSGRGDDGDERENRAAARSRSAIRTNAVDVRAPGRDTCANLRRDL